MNVEIHNRGDKPIRAVLADRSERQIQPGEQYIAQDGNKVLELREMGDTQPTTGTPGQQEAP